MRLGLYGGTFDPVHLGHLILAECCRESAALDEIWFIPNARSPHKQGVSMSDEQHRVRMIQLAIGGHESFHIWTRELERGGLSYTVDTLIEIQARRPQDDLYLLMGADTFTDFPNWKQPDEICRLATPLVVGRPQSPPPDLSMISDWLPDARLDEIRERQIIMPLIDISSSDIRHRVRDGQSIRYRTPRAVEKYIETHGLYADSHRRGS